MLHNLDCLELLKTLPDNSIDLINTDPPYFEIMKNDWDNQWEDEDAYLDWCREWTEECFRVLKPGGCFYVWGTTKTDTFLRYKLEVLNKIPNTFYQNWIIWHYDWGGRTKKTFPRKHEDCLMYSKGKDFDFFADNVRVPYRMAKNARQGASNNPKGKVPTDVWEKNNHTTSKEYVNWHPTQKPFEILQRQIAANTKVGDVVLDIFSGSGSTWIASELIGRKFIGCEKSEDYYNRSIIRHQDYFGKKIKKVS